MKYTEQTPSMKEKDVVRAWHLIDADGLVVGRLASVIATILRGKHKAIFTPNIDAGDYVVVVNADKVVFTGKKTEEKKYYHHTGFPGGIKETTPKKLLKDEKGERILEKAVERMISRNKLGTKMMKKLFVYAGPNHPHAGQNPVKLDVAKMNRKNKRSV